MYSMMKRFFLWCLLVATPMTTVLAQSGKVFISTSFHEPATEGLRFIYSRDGWTWQQVDGVWLRPEVGQQRVMRDPSIIQTPDGIFHLVWTSVASIHEKPGSIMSFVGAKVLKSLVVV